MLYVSTFCLLVGRGLVSKFDPLSSMKMSLSTLASGDSGLGRFPKVWKTIRFNYRARTVGLSQGKEIGVIRCPGKGVEICLVLIDVLLGAPNAVPWGFNVSFPKKASTNGDCFAAILAGLSLFIVGTTLPNGTLYGIGFKIPGGGFGAAGSEWKG